VVKVKVSAAWAFSVLAATKNADPAGFGEQVQRHPPKEDQHRAAKDKGIERPP